MQRLASENISLEATTPVWEVRNVFLESLSQLY